MVGQEHREGIRIDLFLAQTWPEHSRVFYQKCLSEHRVLANGEHCRRAIEDALAAIAEVRQVHVDVVGKTVEVRLAAGERQAADRARAAIEAAGYAVEGERLLEG